jgi:hypothetical protein
MFFAKSLSDSVHALLWAKWPFRQSAVLKAILEDLRVGIEREIQS